MKREEIKSDPIKDKIVEVINLLGDNSKTVWAIILIVGLGISILSYLNSSNKSILLKDNLNSGIMQNRFIHSDEDKALLVDEYKAVMLAFDHGYFQGATTGLERIDVKIMPLAPYADTLMLTRGILRSIVPPSFTQSIVMC